MYFVHHATHIQRSWTTVIDCICFVPLLHLSTVREGHRPDAGFGWEAVSFFTVTPELTCQAPKPFSNVWSRNIPATYRIIAIEWCASIIYITSKSWTRSKGYAEYAQGMSAPVPVHVAQSYYQPFILTQGCHILQTHFACFNRYLIITYIGAQTQKHSRILPPGTEVHPNNRGRCRHVFAVAKVPAQVSCTSSCTLVNLN